MVLTEPLLECTVKVTFPPASGNLLQASGGMTISPSLWNRGDSPENLRVFVIFGVSRAARRLRNAARVRFPSEIKQAVEACRDVRGGMRNADCCRLRVRVEPPFNA